jgi:hypothetical protein
MQNEAYIYRKYNTDNVSELAACSFGWWLMVGADLF